MRRFILLVLVLVVAAVERAAADPANVPPLVESAAFELGTNREGGVSQQRLEAELALSVPLVTSVAVGTLLVFESEGEASEILAETLALNGEWRGIGWTAGRFTPDFGLAWRLAPGVFGADLAEEHELTGRHGLALRLAGLGHDRLGRVGLSLAAFDPGLRSVALALEVEDLLGVPGLRAHAASLSLAEPGSAGGHELAFALAGRLLLRGVFEIAPLAEIVVAAGRAGEGRPDLAATFGLEVAHGSLALSLAQSTRRTRTEDDSSLLTASLGWRLPGGFEIALAGARDSTAGVASHRVGLHLAWAWERHG